MVKLISGKGFGGEAIPGEAVGLMPPTSYIQALLDFTAKLDKEDVEKGMKKAHEVSGPVDTIARKVKAMSLFPSIYRGPQHQRTFKNIKTDDNDGENYYEDRGSNSMARATKETRKPAKAARVKFPAKEKEPERNPELLKKKVLK